MRLLIQRVREASVAVGGVVHSHIERGLLIFAGVENADGEEDIEWLCRKVAGLRIFDDAAGVMNLDVNQAGGRIMVVSQFTLHASTRRGNRPSYVRAAHEEVSRPLYERFVERLGQVAEMDIATGVFGADMKVSLVNDGPVTIWIDSKNRE